MDNVDYVLIVFGGLLVLYSKATLSTRASGKISIVESTLLATMGETMRAMSPPGGTRSGTKANDLGVGRSRVCL